MRQKIYSAILVLFLAPSLLDAGVNPAQSKIVSVITRQLGETSGIAGDLSVHNNLISTNPGAQWAWANNASEVKRLISEGKRVIVGSVDQLKAGAVIAVVIEGGKPVLYINESKKDSVNSDAILKMAKFV